MSTIPHIQLGHGFQKTPETPQKPEIAPTKMFSKDIILYDPQTKTHTTTYSHVRSQTPLAGILVLQGNRTYGSSKQKQAPL
jgi:hypothetical protein